MSFSLRLLVLLVAIGLFAAAAQVAPLEADRPEVPSCAGGCD